MGEVRTGYWFCLAWQEEPETNSMLFTMESYTTGYVSIGFGEVYGMMTPADCVYGWIDEATSEPVVTDRKNKVGYNPSTIDTQQDAVAVSGSFSEGLVRHA